MLITPASLSSSSSVSCTCSRYRRTTASTSAALPSAAAHSSQASAGAVRVRTQPAHDYEVARGADGTTVVVVPVRERLGQTFSVVEVLHARQEARRGPESLLRSTRVEAAVVFRG